MASPSIPAVSSQSQNNKMPTITITLPMKGISRHFTAPNAALEGKAHEYSKSTGIDMHRANFEGHISPAAIANQEAFTSNVNSIARNMITDPSTAAAVNTYAMLGGLSGTAPRIYVIVSDAYSSHHDITAHGGHNFTPVPSGVGFWGEDVILYQIGSS